ncbi:MAG: hypothetical protein J6P98_02265 [Clostridia bacterium]|nr:hypothetical protein [Clostridia bacterium]
MDLVKFDGKCVRIVTAWGEVFEGVASYDDREYSLHEYGRDQEALHITPILLYKDDISDVISLDDVNGPFGHYSEKYGLLEKKCLDWGTDMIEEVFDSDDDDGILRMLACMKDNLQALAERAVPGMAPWRSGMSASGAEDDDNGQGPVYLGELEKMLNTLVKYNENEEVVNEAKGLLEQLSAYFSETGVIKDAAK